MKKTVSILVCLIAFAITGFSQITFQKTYGSAGTDAIHGARKTTDGGYIAVGNTLVSGYDDAYIIKVNSNGDTLWTKAIGGSSYDNAYDVDVTSDGGYIVTGGTRSFGAGSYYDVYLLRLNSSGGLLWSKKYDGGVYDAIGYSVYQTSDGGFIIGGDKSGSGGGGNYSLIKTDSNGDTLWTRNFGSVGAATRSCQSMKPTADGGYVMAGYGYAFGAGLTDIYVVKANSNGTYLWSKTYGTASWEYSYDMIQTTDGGLLFSGYGDGGMFLIKTNSIGDTTWCKRYDYTGVADYGSYVYQTSDGGYILSGTTAGGGAGNNIGLIKLDNSANIQWQKVYASTGSDNINGVLQTNDGGYLVSGYTNGTGAGSFDAHLIKTNSSGISTGCLEVASIFTKYNNALTITNPATVVAAGSTTVTAVSSVVSNPSRIIKNIQTPTANFSSSVSGSTGTFTSSSLDVDTYLWDFGDGTFSTSQNPVHNYAVAGNYNVCLTASNVCGNNSICKTISMSVAQTRFQRTFGGTNADIGRSIHRNTDGSYIIAGETQSFGSGMQDIYLLQLNTAGGLSWSKTFGGAGNEAAYSVTEHIAGGGNYLITSQSDAFAGGDALVMTVSTGGGLLWSQAFGGNSGDYPYSIIETSDGKFVTAGFTRSLPSGYESLHMMKISDVTGDTLWTRGFDDAFNEGYAYDVKQTTDGGYILTGETWYQGPRDVYAVKMTSSGAITWKKSIPSGTGRSVVETSGGYVITGDETSGNGDVFLTKIDNSGNMLWKKTYGTTGYDEGYQMKKTPDGGFVICGFTQPIGLPSSALLIRTDSDGNHLWSKTYGGSSYDYAYSVDLAADGGFILSGETTSFGSGNKDVYIIKTDTLGVSGTCNEANALLTVVSTSPAASAVGGTVKYLGTKNGNGASIGNPSTITTYPSQVSINYSVTTPVTCFGDNDGSVNAFSVSGGTQPYTYNWSTGATTSAISNLPSGTYSLTVYDQNGCSGNISATITDPPDITYTVSATDVTCNGSNNGTITINASGGTGALTYSNDNGFSYQGGNVFSGLAPTTYTVVVKDANNCTKTSTVTITQPNALGLTNVTTNVTCNAGNDGAIDITTSGGTTPYTFSWSNSASTEDVSGLAVGNYALLVTDANGCTKNQNYLVNEPPAVAASVSVTNVNCNGGSNGTATVNVSVGVFPFTYLWDAATGSQTTQAATSLSAGTYSVVVTDADGCVGTFFNTITEPAVLTSTISPTDANCNGGSNGSVNLSVSGGTSPYTFLWSTSATTQNLSSIPAGTYSVTITDSKGCVATNIVTVNQPTLLTSVVSKTDVTCNGNCDGTAAASPTGGTPPYFYSWQTSPVQTTQTATGLCPGIYNVNISDNNNCQITPNVTIAEPAVLSAIVSTTGATCGSANGTATAFPSGGTSPYTYLWSNSDTNQTANGLGTGTYSLSITDLNGCTTSASGTVSDTTLSVPICVVTVDSTSTKNVIWWDKPVNAPIDSFRIYRDISSTFTYIGSASYNSLSTFTDSTLGVNPNFTSYRYKISVLDTCGFESDTSSYHKTILLQVSPAIPSGYALDWDDYLGMTVTEYKILRDTTGTGNNWQAIDSVGFSTTAYTDPIPWDTVNYMIETDHPTGCTATVKNPTPMASNLNSSRSNVYKIIDSTSTGVNANAVDGESLIAIYPNPSNGIFIIEVKEKNTSVKIFNMLGDEIRKINAVYNREKISIDISRYAKGMYYIQASSGKNITTRKIILK